MTLSKISCPVGQITGISSSSQEFWSPRRETGRGLFQSSRAFRHREEQSEEAIQSSPNDLEKFDTSGKSPAYLHHRKNFGVRAEKLAAGFFNRAAFFRHREEQSEEAIQSSPNDFEKI
jgi:hypothetical protein